MSSLTFGGGPCESVDGLLESCPVLLLCPFINCHLFTRFFFPSLSAIVLLHYHLQTQASESHGDCVYVTLEKAIASVRLRSEKSPACKHLSATMTGHCLWGWCAKPFALACAPGEEHWRRQFDVWHICKLKTLSRRQLHFLEWLGALHNSLDYTQQWRCSTGASYFLEDRDNFIASLLYFIAMKRVNGNVSLPLMKLHTWE